MNDCHLLKKDSDTWSYATALEQASLVKAIAQPVICISYFGEFLKNEISGQI
jgi:hypothetical protein